MGPKYKPMVPPNPLSNPLGDFDAFRLDDRELFLMDSYANEHVGILGAKIEYWFIDVKGSTKDPLYNEPTVRAFVGPFKFIAYFSYTESTPEVREDGITERYQPHAWIPRKMVEESAAPIPFEGDVLRAWNIPFYAQYGTADRNPDPSAGYYFNIIDVDTDGHLFDNPTFVGYKLQLRRRTEFTPERRIQRP